MSDNVQIGPVDGSSVLLGCWANVMFTRVIIPSRRRLLRSRLRSLQQLCATSTCMWASFKCLHSVLIKRMTGKIKLLWFKFKSRGDSHRVAHMWWDGCLWVQIERVHPDRSDVNVSSSFSVYFCFLRAVLEMFWPTYLTIIVIVKVVLIPTLVHFCCFQRIRIFT